MSTEESSSCSGATGRSRRAPSKTQERRSAALERLRAAKEKKWSYSVEEEMTDNVYDIVDEKEYSRKVQSRLEDDFIVDDDGQYVEDGREIFDDEYQDNEPDRSGRNCRRPGVGKRKAEEGVESKKRKSKSIKTMLRNMPAKKVEEKVSGSIESDELLQEMLQDLRARKGKSSASNSSIKLSSENHLASNKPKLSTRDLVNSPFAVSNKPFKVENKVKGKDLEDIHSSAFLEALDKKQEVQAASQIIEEDDEEEQLMKSVLEDEDPFEVDDEPSQVIDDHTQQNNKKRAAVELEESISNAKVDANMKETKSPVNRGFELKRDTKETNGANCSQLFQFCQPADETTKNDSSPAVSESTDTELPLIKLEGGERALRIFWLDAFEDPFKHAGTVWLFGKVQLKGSFVSCCVQVKNISRRVYLLKREKRFNTKTNEEMEDEVSMGDVYNEFATKIAERYRIAEHRSKPVEKSYAFEQKDVPQYGEYLEVHYDPKYNALPSDLKGETFSKVFGANQSSLEKFLIDRRIKGPSWVDIKACRPSNPPMSWCRLEAICDDDELVSVSEVNDAPPPLTVLSLRLKTVVNPKTMLHEVAFVSGLVQSDFKLDRPAPKPAFNNLFCCMTKPQDEEWPFDLAKELSGQKIKIEKMDSERVLLSYLVARIGKIDPDVIVGHDLASMDTEILMHRLQRNKVIHWSRVSRLRRGHVPTNKSGRIIEKMAFTGRLVCDLKISSKELIRCKSYDLAALTEKLLGKSAGQELTSDELRKCYQASQTLLHACNTTLTEGLDILQCVYDLNALPLALQITRVAGNVLSRTLLGGRAERNEFLLLHAFNDKNFICPDKQYNNHSHKKHHKNDNGDEEENEVAATRSSKRKPAYAGGLVLDPKVGFYDKFVLLMDFNSLYPSIIQEYNICFTTVARAPPKAVASVDHKAGTNSKSKTNEPDDWIPDLPDVGREVGVLPTEIRKLVESRKAVKNLLKDSKLSAEKIMQYDIRQKALKLTANSMYGCLGFSHSRFFAKPMAALITAKGREILLQTKELVERLDLEVIYGDTDSIMINSNTQDFAEVMKMGARIKQEVNKLYKLLELDVDGVYKFMLLLKKKKYAAVAVQQSKKSNELISSIELKGLDIVRRDWSQLASDVGRTILEKILSECSNDDRVLFIHETLENLALMLKEGKVPLQQLAITKQLTKNPNEYANNKALPHVQVAQRINAKGQRRLRQGDTVAYVICDDGTNNAATQRAYDLDEVRNKDSLSVDINYYLAQQIHPVVSRLCEPLEGTDSARIAGSLGLDPENYRNRSNGPSGVSGNDTRESLKGEEERFRNCSYLQINCTGCSSVITLDTATRLPKQSTSTTERVLALAECPSIDCQTCPIKNWAKIENQLMIEMRGHLKRFYKSVLICEDPACSGRRRALTLNFVGTYPKCNKCNNALMFKEYEDKELYTQMLYYQHLFDIRRQELRYKLGAVDVEVRRGYGRLKNFIDAAMTLNRYSIVDMSKLFAGFNPVKAAKFRQNQI